MILQNTNNILITGATGFIGKHLYQRLKPLKYNVTGTSLEGGEVANEKITILDITDRKAVEKFFTEKEFNIVFHLAAIKVEAKKDNLETAKRCFLVNGLGTLHILEEIKKQRSCKIIYASTIEVYGPRGSISVISEDVMPQPRSFYAISKFLGEYYCKKHFKDFRIPYICLRLASVYGQGQPPTSLIPVIIEQARDNEDIVVYGQGKGCFDFLFIEDLLNTMIDAGNSPETGIFNIGSGSTISVRALCKKVKNIWNSASRIIFNEAKTENCYNIQLDIQKAKQQLHYSPQYTIDKGLERLKGK